MSPIDVAAAEWAYERDKVSGRDSGTLTASDWQYHPLETSLGVLGVLGVLGIAIQGSGDPMPADKRVLFSIPVGQTALAHERLKLEANAREVGALKQRDDLRATLLSSLGHGLKTPLTAVVAAADALAAGQGKSATTSTLKAEARRIRRAFDDLVEMIRIEAGALALRREVTDLTDAMAAAVANLRAELVLHKPVLDVPPTLSLVEAAPRMLHHIFINLLGNAAKFAPAATPITIQSRRVQNGLTLSVLDEGPGLPSGRDTTLFDRFTRANGDDMSGGTGLGLAIVKGFTEAMDLSVAAGNRADGGAAFEITWPEASIRRSEK